MKTKQDHLEKDTSRISITAHHTGYTWYANNLSHKAFATLPGQILYHSSRPWMFLGRTVLGISDLETSLLQRHLILDYLLEQTIKKSKVSQVLELACGLSPRGFRFKKKTGFKDILYIEADLPGMVKHKKALLQKEGLLGPRHKVITCNILSENSEYSLENIAKKYLDPAMPTAVITEGIVNYFDISTMNNLWSRIASLLQSFSGGVYLSDNMPNPTGNPYSFILEAWNQIVSLIARGRFHMHFSSDQEVEKAFKSLGFTKIINHRPESFSATIQLPISRFGSFLRVIEASV